MHTVYLALGTNLGDRAANLRSAIAALPPVVRARACSPIYETPPWGVTDQPAFLNQVVEVETDLPPLDLLHHIKSLETRMGRQPGARYGPRLIDLDVLLYDDLILDSTELTIPHPRLAERAFVLVPLADLAPQLLHPVSGKMISQLLSGVDRTGIERYQDGYEHACN